MLNTSGHVCILSVGMLFKFIASTETLALIPSLVRAFLFWVLSDSSHVTTCENGLSMCISIAVSTKYITSEPDHKRIALQASLGGLWTIRGRPDSFVASSQPCSFDLAFHNLLYSFLIGPPVVAQTYYLMNIQKIFIVPGDPLKM